MQDLGRSTGIQLFLEKNNSESAFPWKRQLPRKKKKKKKSRYWRLNAIVACCRVARWLIFWLACGHAFTIWFCHFPWGCETFCLGFKHLYHVKLVTFFKHLTSFFSFSFFLIFMFFLTNISFLLFLSCVHLNISWNEWMGHEFFYAHLSNNLGHPSSVCSFVGESHRKIWVDAARVTSSGSLKVCVLAWTEVEFDPSSLVDDPLKWKWRTRIVINEVGNGRDGHMKSP